MLILEEFWKGNICPGEQRYRLNCEYSKAYRVMEATEEQLKKNLSEDDWKFFRQFADAAQEASALSDCDSFMEGFRMGAKMMLDVLLEPQR